MKEKRQVLKQYFGYDSFRPGQEQVVDALLEGRDVLAVMPTGAGKSICFQVPALLMEGITLVISPLVSLMKDQVMTLVANGVAGAYLNSSLTERQYEKAVENAKRGKYKIIYVAPERLLTPRFLSFALSAPISMVAVDEAHCVSQWGQDFRPSYLDIALFLEKLPKRPVVGAFTATATPKVKRDILALLQLQNPYGLGLGFDRPNLLFRVMEPRDKRAALWDFLQEQEGKSGIIYCATRKAVEEICTFLQEKGKKAVSYHGGMDHKEREKNQEDFLFDRVELMVATNAFGMGIDKPNVRFVVHYQMPRDIESYYQEAGRAGRDGQKAQCLLLYAKKDVALQQFLIRNNKENDHLEEEQRAKVQLADEERLKQMTWYCKTKDCLRRFLLRYFDEAAPKDCHFCGNCLGYARTEEVDLLPEERIFSKNPFWSAEGGFSFVGRKRQPQWREHPLFDQLKEVRKRMAERNGVPAFVIFSDATLEEMVEKMPRTEKQLLRISGVGQKKLDLYGQAFLEAISDYCNQC